jgi:hypothetical protein
MMIFSRVVRSKAVSPVREESTEEFLQCPPEPHFTHECDYGEQQGQGQAGDQGGHQLRVLIGVCAGERLQLMKKAPASARSRHRGVLDIHDVVVGCMPLLARPAAGFSGLDQQRRCPPQVQV